jgi:hypothetical protein
MLKIGLVGNIKSLQPCIGFFKKEPRFELIGKSSVGLMDQPGGIIVSVPEFSRSALIDAADALIIDRAGMLSFSLIKEAVKKYKHLYFNDIPELVPEQCNELQKLVAESGTIFQVRNPMLDHPFARWIFQNSQEPSYISYAESFPEIPGKRDLILPVLLFAQHLFKTSPQKIRVTGIHQPGSDHAFINLRLDYSTYSAMNTEWFVPAEKSLIMKAVLPGMVMEYGPGGRMTVNHKTVPAEGNAEQELSDFAGNLIAGFMSCGTGLQPLSKALITYEEIYRKMTQYIPWYT